MDPDHDRLIAPAEPMSANIAYPTDGDGFVLELTTAQSVTVAVDYMDFDADLVVDRVGNMGDVLTTDDVSGVGVMGWDGIRSSPSRRANRAQI